MTDTCALTSAALGPVYVNTPVLLSNAKLPSPPASVTDTAALALVLVKYRSVDPSTTSSVVNSVKSTDNVSVSAKSLYDLEIPFPPTSNVDTLSSTLSLVKNKFVGELDASAISSRSNVMSAPPLNDTPFIFLAVCKVVAVVALPTTAAVTWLNVTSSVVPTACPMLTIPDVSVTPVPPEKCALTSEGLGPV